ncbi:unnamed protein product [Trifolium pratense]|uniref:Uncharacterized protein n=1 Tax=Trifolium pratense TaxID=57577 RepID=A0ACB0LLU1_TRIPR|nr:unnamed protein product [Trifolium pratense]
MAAPNSTSLKFSILLIMLLVCNMHTTMAVTVTIINGVRIPPNPTTITVHCKSKDDDLGFHTLPYTGSYTFTFTPNIFYTTLFFCSFTWPGNPHRHYLDIYDDKHDNCNECVWHINLGGGCLNDHKCGPWKSIDLIDAQPATF